MLVEPGVKNFLPTAVTHPPPGTVDRNPAFAPTSTAIVIAYIQRVGNAAHQLCFVAATIDSRSNTCTTVHGWDLGGQVNWSPDGSTILVLGTKNNGANFGLLSFSSTVPYSGKASNWAQPTLVTDASTPKQGIFAGAFSPDGKWLALVAGSDANGYDLYIVKAGNVINPQPQNGLQVTACQISWRSDSKALAVMQPDGQCGPKAIGKIVRVDVSDPGTQTTLTPLGAHPAYQAVPG